MCLRPSLPRVSATAVLALILSLGFANSGALTSRCAPAPQEKGKGQKQDPNVDVGVKAGQPPPPRPLRTNLKYKILKRESDGHGEETSPDSTFMADDRIQIRITHSKIGYLYIIQSEGDKDGDLIFPHSGIGGHTERH